MIPKSPAIVMTNRLECCILSLRLYQAGQTMELGLKRSEVLIVSSHPLFAEAISHLLQERGISNIHRVDSLAGALPRLDAPEINVIIVDYDEPLRRDTEVASQLVGHAETRQVIFLTLAGNQMIVHHRERVENVTVDDLIQALHSSGAA
jgi:DNA-binding NarL/FixJ family response regulator